MRIALPARARRWNSIDTVAEGIKQVSRIVLCRRRLPDGYVVSESRGADAALRRDVSDEIAPESHQVIFVVAIAAAFFLPPRCRAKATTNAMTRMTGVITSSSRQAAIHQIEYRRDHVAAEVSSVGLDALRAVKDRLDPTGILNPGKLLPPNGSGSVLDSQ